MKSDPEITFKCADMKRRLKMADVPPQQNDSAARTDNKGENPFYT